MFASFDVQYDTRLRYLLCAAANVTSRSVFNSGFVVAQPTSIDNAMLSSTDNTPSLFQPLIARSRPSSRPLESQVHHNTTQGSVQRCPQLHGWPRTPGQHIPRRRQSSATKIGATSFYPFEYVRWKTQDLVRGFPFGDGKVACLRRPRLLRYRRSAGACMDCSLPSCSFFLLFGAKAALFRQSLGGWGSCVRQTIKRPSLPRRGFCFQISDSQSYQFGSPVPY